MYHLLTKKRAVIAMAPMIAGDNPDLVLDVAVPPVAADPVEDTVPLDEGDV